MSCCTLFWCRPLLCLTVALAALAAAGVAISPLGAEEGCNAEKPSATASLTAAEKRVVEFVTEKVIEGGGVPSFEETQLEKVAGVPIEELRLELLQPAVMAMLADRGFDLASLASGNQCQRFSACSVDRNLALASGVELERYEAEKAEDGAVFESWEAPDFTLPSTAGDEVSLRDFRGSPVVLTFLSGHCFHSLDTLPILATLIERHAANGVVFLPVFVNSGDVETLASRSWELNVNYPLLVSEEKAVSEAFRSRMVPSTFLIDRRGYVRRKLVGFKDEGELDAALTELLARLK